MTKEPIKYKPENQYLTASLKDLKVYLFSHDLTYAEVGKKIARRKYGKKVPYSSMAISYTLNDDPALSPVVRNDIRVRICKLIAKLELKKGNI